MQHIPPMDTAVPEGDTAEITVPPTMHHPAGHGLQDTLDIVGHDEVEHDEALRNSQLRVPR
ncbi:hypothetical protein [Dyella terrae]|uniref:hypothetical protein n=1 Tax=Dyella terrae TaxID=522259 RepID=UPI001EFD9542|nr:hypothetical protein [Dyella terrae]ULU24712.1 hypothetical protein DYST_01632 [Dyella terrae]